MIRILGLSAPCAAVASARMAAPSGRVDLKAISEEVLEEREKNRLRTLEYSWTTRTESVSQA